MAKAKTLYKCTECGFESPKWWGVCPECNAYGSMEEQISTGKSNERKIKNYTPKAQLLNNIESKVENRFSTHIEELDRVLGGGIVRGSIILIGGEPGIGKSTMLLQMAEKISKTKKVLYISGEESKEQIKLRAERMNVNSKKLLLLTEIDMDIIQNEILNQMPEVVIIDSIQTMTSQDLGTVPGTVSQIRENAGKLINIGKNNNISIFIVGHVTKEGSIAGPKILEHLVDTVIYFEGERFHTYRMIRAIKNRFGSTNELGVFEMTEKGLEQIKNPSATMLSEKPANVPGSVIIASMEGTRPMLTEVQALVSPSGFSVPRRTATGVDFNRLNMIIAVLEKRARLNIQQHDIYVNLTGGVRNNEPSIDLGIALAIYSSFKNIPIDDKTVVFGEMGLTGEIRSVTHGEKRISEAESIGFTRIILPKGNTKANIKTSIQLMPVQSIIEAINGVK